jgi:hypothetical protein
MGGSDTHAKRARLERVAFETERIARDVRAWIARRRKRDPRGLHRARIDALEGALLGAIARLSSGAALSLEMPAGALYRAASAEERRLALIDRVFAYFRLRFDQRDAEPAGDLLDAADEVVRSLYVQPFRAAGSPAPAAPLAYVEPAFSPRAIPREEPPSELRTDDDLLRAALARMPFGVVGLPAWCAEGPWTLVYLAHEIGHHVQFDLAPDAGLVKMLRKTLRRAASPAGLGDDDTSFQRWSMEIFADAFSIVTLGPVAIEAIAELERADDAAMLAPSGPAYPSAAVRFALMTAFAGAVGLDVGGALAGVDPVSLAGIDAVARSEPQRRAAAHLGAVSAVASALAAAPLAGGLTLAQLAALRAADFAPDGDVAAWASALAAGKRRSREPTLRGTRRVLAASWVAWRTVCRIDGDAARAEAMQALREVVLLALAENREPATLAAPGRDEAITFGHDLGDFLRARSAEELGA